MKLLDYISARAYAQGPVVSTGSSTSGTNLSLGNFTRIFGHLNTGGTGNGGIKTLFDIVITVIDWFLVVVAIIAFVYLVLYGVKYITSGGDAAKATEARNGIINAIIGIIVITLAFFIINVAVGIGNNPLQTP